MKMIIAKLMKSELWVALGASLIAVLAPKLGIPPEQLSELWTVLGAIASSYILGRSYAKPREAMAAVAPVDENPT